MHAAVELQHIFAAGRLVQAVDVLRYHGAQSSLRFELRKAQVRGVRFGIQRYHFVAVILEKRLGIAVEKTARDNLLWWQLIFLCVQSIGAAKVGDAAFGRHARAAEKHHATRRAFVDPLVEKFDFFFGLRAHCHLLRLLLFPDSLIWSIGLSPSTAFYHIISLCAFALAL